MLNRECMLSLTMKISSLPVPEVDDEPPPFLGRWSRVYGAVLCYLFLLVCGLYCVTRFFG